MSEQKNRQQAKLILTDNRDGHDLIAEVEFYEQDTSVGTNHVLGVQPRCTCGWAIGFYSHLNWAMFQWSVHRINATRKKSA